MIKPRDEGRVLVEAGPSPAPVRRAAVMLFESGPPVVMIADDERGRRVAIGPRVEVMHLDEWPAGEEPGQ